MTRPTCFVNTCDRQTTAGLCNPHRNALLDHLDGLRDIVDDLNTQLTRQARYSTANTSTSDGVVMWNEGASRTLIRVQRTMTTWDRLVHDRLAEAIRHPNPLHAAASIRTAIKTGRLNDWPSLATLITDLDDLATRAARTIDRPTIEHFLGICTTPISITTTGQCDNRLYGKDDTDTTTCPRCGSTHIVDTTLELLLTISDDTLVTAAQAARAMSTKDDADNHRNRLEARIRQWHTRGRLVARGTINDAGRQRKLYRLGDVRALVAEHDRHTTRR